MLGSRRGETLRVDKEYRLIRASQTLSVEETNIRSVDGLGLIPGSIRRE